LSLFENVIFSGGEAGARDFTWVESVDAVERSAFGVYGVKLLSTASTADDLVRSLRGLSPSSE
jgi:hypothetical protein